MWHCLDDAKKTNKQANSSSAINQLLTVSQNQGLGTNAFE